MSSEIEFNRQFIRSEAGITPVWLHGDNRTTTGYGRHERYCRHWSLFWGKLGTTEEELLEEAKNYMGSYQEHWLKNGKYVDDDGLLRWIRNGCKSAATIEEILLVNKIRAISCCLYVYDGPENHTHHEELSVSIATTKDFDAWISNVRKRTAELEAENHLAYPNVDFLAEDLRHPIVRKNGLPNKVIFKRGKYYLVEQPTQTIAKWSSDVNLALEFTSEEAKALLNAYGESCFLCDARIISASVKRNLHNFVIKIEGGTHDGNYVVKKTRTRLQMGLHKDTAKHYHTLRAAEQAAVKLQAQFQNLGGVFKVLADDEKVAR